MVNYAKSLNFEIYIIDPRGYFASKKRFSDVNIINKWPEEAFKELETDESSALIALTHDPKIDDPAIKHALDKKFYYIGALGSKKTHSNRCSRLNEFGFSANEIKRIFGPRNLCLHKPKMMHNLYHLIQKATMEQKTKQRPLGSI